MKKLIKHGKKLLKKIKKAVLKQPKRSYIKRHPLYWDKRDIDDIINELFESWLECNKNYKLYQKPHNDIYLTITPMDYKDIFKQAYANGFLNGQKLFDDKIFKVLPEIKKWNTAIEDCKYEPDKVLIYSGKIKQLIFEVQKND